VVGGTPVRYPGAVRGFQRTRLTNYRLALHETGLAIGLDLGRDSELVPELFFPYYAAPVPKAAAWRTRDGGCGRYPGAVVRGGVTPSRHRPAAERGLIYCI
jgi:hypothetical protein